MKRIPVTPRLDYREKIEALGFDFHGDYWREEAYYRFTAEETACLEEATNEAYRLYCEAAQFIIEDNPEFMERALNIPKEIGERIRASCLRHLLSNGNGKRMFFRNATSLMVFMKDWCSHGKIFSPKKERFILLVH